MGKSKTVTIGYKYSAGMHMIICHGPVDAVLAITAGEKLAWSGNVTGNQQISINNPNLFGGEKKEGGIVGAVDIEFGGSTQGQNGYLASRLGSSIPAYRGVLGLVLRKVYLTAMSQYIKPWSILVRRIASKDWAPAYSNIGGGSNPAHIIREVLTHKSWGMGLPVAKIDDASFTAAAIALYNEGFGLSLSLNGQTQCEDFILNILKHISAVMYNDRITGNYKLKLIRNDYNIATIPSFNEDNIISFNSFERPQFAEMVNEVIVVYQPQGQKDKQSVSIQDLSSIQAQGGVVSQTINYVGIDNQGIASRVAQRDLRQYSTPLAQLRITVNRDGWKLEPGAVFKLTWASHGITDMVCRATNINLGDYKGHQIVVDAVEDIFSLPTTSYLTTQTPQWVDPVGSPVAAPSQEARELPYWDIQRQFNPGYLAEVDSLSGYVQFLAETPTVASPGYILDTKHSSVSTYTQQEEFGYVPKAKLLADITYTQTSMSLKDVTGNLEDVAIGTYAYIENEIVRIDSINLSTLVVTMGRGCLDSVPKPHAANAPIWFADDFAGVDFTEWLVGDSVNCKALTKTGSGVLSEAAAPVSTVTMAGRQFKPYPPGKLRINNLAYPSQIAGALSISWAHRDRTQQLASIISEEYGNVGPETGLTYSLKLYDEKNILRVNQSGITSTTFAWTTEQTDSALPVGRLNEYVRIELWSVRETKASSQIHDFSVYRPQIPFCSILPTVSGTSTVGSDISCTTGTWDFSPTAYAYQWTKNLSDIVGQVNNTYTIAESDKGGTLACKVTATNVVGSVTVYSVNSIRVPLDGVSQSYSQYATALTPVLYYRLNEVAGTDLVPAIGSVNLTLSGSGYTLNTAGLLYSDADSCINFTSVNSYAISSTTPSAALSLGTGDFSVSLVISFTINTFKTILAIRDGVGLTDMLLLITCSRISAGDISAETWGWSDANTRVRSAGGMNTGTPRHVVVRFTNALLKLELFVDGVLVDTRTQPAGRPTTPNRLIIGNNTNLAQGPGDKMDELLLFNRALTNYEISRLNYIAKNGPLAEEELWKPNNLTSSILWYDASDSSTYTTVSSAISEWRDKGGSNKTWTQTDVTKRPALLTNALGGLTAFRFDGTTDELITSEFMPADAMTWVLFHKLNTLPPGSTVDAAINLRSSAASITEVLLCDYAGYQPYQILNDFTGSTTGVGIADALDTNVKSLIWTYNNGANNSPSSYNIRLNGTSKTVVASGATTITDLAISKIASRVAQDFRTNMDLYEIIGIPGVASTATMEKLEGYMFHKWGCPENLPAAHPYKALPPVNAPEWTPADMTTRLWLDAADAASITVAGAGVSVWSDKSGNGNHATQATDTMKPTLALGGIGNINVLNFDGSNDIMSLTADVTITTEMCVCTVFRRATSSIQSLPVGGPTSAHAHAIEWYTDNILYSKLGTSYITLTPANSSTGFFICSDVRDATNASIFLNGSIMGGGPKPAPAIGNALRNIGGLYSPYFHNGYLAEVVIFNTISMRQKVEGYLAWKWSLQASLPSDHPYKSSPPRP